MLISSSFCIVVAGSTQREEERRGAEGVPGSGKTALGSEVFAVDVQQELHGGRKDVGSLEIFGRGGGTTLQPQNEEDH